MSIDWKNVRRVLVVRLRSIGDTVLTTPSLIALRRFLPDARIDILLEDWVAPLLDGFDAVDNVITVEKSVSRINTARELRRNRYDVVFNLHGGTTGTFFTAASRATHRIGYSHYQYAFLHNHLLGSAKDFWHRDTIHSAEQHLALLGFLGIPVEDKPRSRLIVTEKALLSVKVRTACVSGRPGRDNFALLHPAAAFATKQWPTENFARVAEHLHERRFKTIAIVSKDEAAVLADLAARSTKPILIFDDLSLSEITALASKAKIFVGNDSGIAHIAAAVGCPSVVIFGSSNRDHWRPWTDAPNEIVYEKFHCQPCPGHECREFGEPRCILSVRTDDVFAAIEKILRNLNYGK